MNLLWITVALLALILIDVPIGVALGLVAVAATTLEWGAHVLPNMGLTLFDAATSFTLIAIPLFILAGSIMNVSGISRRLLAFVSSLVGFVRGDEILRQARANSDTTVERRHARHANENIALQQPVQNGSRIRAISTAIRTAAWAVRLASRVCSIQSLPRSMVNSTSCISR